MTGWYACSGKRAGDILLAALLLLSLSPLLLAIFLLVRGCDGAPVFFRHTRIGKDGRRFLLLKFRSMRLHDELVGEAPEGATLEQMAALRRQFQGTPQGDPRITALGKFLRKTHLDELPQLWNVLIGDMSLVGPRPDTPVQQSDYHPQTWQRRCSVRPGITGLAQVMARRVRCERDRQAFDMAYIRALSPCLDALILIRTGAKIFRADSF